MIRTFFQHKTFSRIQKCLTQVYARLLGSLPRLRIGRLQVRPFTKVKELSDQISDISVERLEPEQIVESKYQPKIWTEFNHNYGGTHYRTRERFLVRGAEIAVQFGKYRAGQYQDYVVHNRDGCGVSEISEYSGSGVGDLSCWGCEERLQGRWTCVLSRRSAIYGHWLCDLFLRLCWLKDVLGKEEFASRSFCLTGEGLAYQNEMLELIGINPSNVVWSAEKSLLRFEEAVVPSLTSTASKRVDPALVDLCREQLISEFESNSTRPADLIYVSRQGENFRRVINEEEVMQRLERLGFKIVHPREVSMADKIRIYRNAELVVGPLSSSVGNCIFMTPGSNFLTLVPFHYYTMPDARIPIAAGLKYHVVQGTNSPSLNSVAGPRCRNMYVNTDQLCRAVEEILA